MRNAVINFKVDATLKKKAQKKAAELGFSLSSVLNAYLNKFTQVKAVDFLDEAELELSDWAKKEIAESEKDYRAGKYIEFDNWAEEEAWLNSMIADAEKKARR